MWTIDHSDLSSGASTIISRSVWSNRRDGRQSRPFFSTRYRRDASIMLINPPTQETLRQGCGRQLLTQGYIGHFIVFQKQTGKGGEPECIFWLGLNERGFPFSEGQLKKRCGAITLLLYWYCTLCLDEVPTHTEFPR